MDRNTPEYTSTKLKKIFFDAEGYENNLEFSLKISHSIQEVEEENDTNRIKILGELEAVNSKEKVVTTILMESSFKTTGFVTEKELKNNDYYHRPLLDEITLLLGSLTGKAFTSPILLPPLSTENEENDRQSK